MQMEIGTLSSMDIWDMEVKSFKKKKGWFRETNPFFINAILLSE